MRKYTVDEMWYDQACFLQSGSYTLDYENHINIFTAEGIINCLNGMFFVNEFENLPDADAFKIVKE